jgi:ABC-2 type transport system ATP-binding protein
MTVAISASHLTRRFGSQLAVDDVSLDLQPSEIVALVGPNGAGKTTTLRIMAGLIAPTSGSVTVGGVRMTRATGSALRRKIGVLTETPGLWDRLSAHENLSVYADLYAVERADEKIGRLLDVLDLSTRADTPAAELSTGMRQKVALARAMLHDPAVLLLDEPMSGLDPASARTVRRLLDERRQAGAAILLSTHNLGEAERLANRVAVLRGRLLAVDAPSVLRRRLTTGRILVRIANSAHAHLAAARRFDPEAVADGERLSVLLPSADRDTPALVRALVEVGADILDVRPETPPLEDVYLHVLGDGAHSPSNS